MFNPVKAVGDAARAATGTVSEAVRDPGKAAHAFREAVEDAAKDVARSPRRALDGVQGALDVAGFIPGVGIVADLANAGISAARGDYAGAALNMVAAVPIVGDAAKGGRMAAKGLGAAADALKAGDRAADAVKVADAAKLGRPAPLQLPAGTPPPWSGRARCRATAMPGMGPGPRLPEAIIVKPNGEARLPRDTSVVTGQPGGCGSGVEVQRNLATNVDWLSDDGMEAQLKSILRAMGDAARGSAPGG